MSHPEGPLLSKARTPPNKFFLHKTFSLSRIQISARVCVYSEGVLLGPHARAWVSESAQVSAMEGGYVFLTGQ